MALFFGQNTSRSPAKHRKKRPFPADPKSSKAPPFPKKRDTAKRGAETGLFPGQPGQKRPKNHFLLQSRYCWKPVHCHVLGSERLYLRIFAFSGRATGRRGKKKTARRLCVSLYISKTYAKTPGRDFEWRITDLNR